MKINFIMHLMILTSGWGVPLARLLSVHVRTYLAYASLWV